MPGSHKHAAISKDPALLKKFAGMTAAQLLQALHPVAPASSTTQSAHGVATAAGGHGSLIAGAGGLGSATEEAHQSVLKALEEAAREKEMAELFKKSGGAEVFRATVAQQLIMKEWIALGGPSSPLGLPLDTNFPLLKTNDGYHVDFRGGGLHFNTASDQVLPTGGQHVVVRFEGYGLEIRQEKGDEIYGNITCMNPSVLARNDFQIQQMDVGPDSNNRVRQFSMILYEGPPTYLNIITNMVESDNSSGTRDAVRAAASEAAKALFDEATAAAGAAGNDPVSIAFDAAAKELNLKQKAADWIGDAADTLLNFILGTNDDPYNPGMLSISAAEMMQNKPIQQYHCWDDSHVLDFTHTITVEGKDDGGDTGRIALLFSVKPG